MFYSKNFKKGAANLAALVVGAVVVGALTVGTTTYFGNETRDISKEGVDKTTNNVTQHAQEAANGDILLTSQNWEETTPSEPEGTPVNPESCLHTQLEKVQGGNQCVNCGSFFEVEEFPRNVYELEKEDLQVALSFNSTKASDEVLEEYEDWWVDFLIYTNKPITTNGNKTEDGYIAGQFFGTWFYLPEGTFEMPANTPLPVVYGSRGVKLPFSYIWGGEETFNCGAYINPEYLEANPDFKLTLELRIFNSNNENETILIGEPYVYTAEDLLNRTN